MIASHRDAWPRSIETPFDEKPWRRFVIHRRMLQNPATLASCHHGGPPIAATSGPPTDKAPELSMDSLVLTHSSPVTAGVH